jgi:hypothetical protein
MAKIVQLKWNGVDAYPQTTTDAIAVVMPISGNTENTNNTNKE